MRGRAPRVHYSLRNSLVIEMSDLLAKDEILEQGRATISSLERILIVVDANTLIGGEKLSTAVFGIFLQVGPFVVIVWKLANAAPLRLRFSLGGGGLLSCGHSFVSVEIEFFGSFS